MLQPSESIVNYAKAFGIILPLLGAAIVSAIGYCKSDDAQGGVDSLIKQLNKRVAKQESIINMQSDKLEKLTRRIIFFQGHQSGILSGKLYEQNQQLEKQLTELKARKIPRSIKLEKLINALNGAKGKQVTKKPVANTKHIRIPRLPSAKFSKRGK